MEDTHTCKHNYTFQHCHQTTRLDLALGPQNLALSGGSRWDNGKFTEATVVSTTTPQPLSSVQVTVRSSAGPVMEGLTITKGCGPKVSGKTGNQCFGLTQAQNLLAGSALMTTGILLLLCPVVSFALVCMGLISCLRG